MRSIRLACVSALGLACLTPAQSWSNDSVAALTKRLHRPEREMAAAQLVLKGREGERALVQSATDQDPEVRRLVAQSLGETMELNGLEVVAKLVDDPYPNVSRTALRTLALAGPKAVEPIEKQFRNVHPSAAWELLSLIMPDNPVGEKEFRRLLRFGAASARAQVISMMGNRFFLRRPEVFRAAAADKSPAIRLALVTTIASNNITQEEERFATNLLSSPDPKTRIQALMTLQGSPTPPWDQVYRMLHDRDREVRKQAIKSFPFTMGSRKNVGRFADLVGDKYPEVRDATVQRLARIAQDVGEMSSLRSQADALYVRWFSATNLPRLRNRLYRRLLSGDSPVSARLLGYLGDRRAFPYLTRQIHRPITLRNDNTPALTALAYSDGPRAAGFLLPSLSQHYDDLVVDALGKTRAKNVVLPLLITFQTRSDTASLAAALASLGDQQATPVLIERARDSDVSVQDRGNLLFPIGELGGPGAVDLFLDVLDDPKLSSIHWQAKAGLQAITDPNAIIDLERAAKERTGVSRDEAIAAAERLSKQIAPRRP